MNGHTGLDATQALQEATTRSDLIRRKQDVDALKKRLGDQSSKQEKLRESCEGFEAIFLQKMWEQMRKTVPKEGYLHSKDEEMYQSLFDIELCKKMASAGGIGLADMLYTQLAQQLEDTGRTTTPGRYRNPLQIAPSESLLGQTPASETEAAQSPSPVPDKKLTAADLYSALPEESPETPEPAQNAPDAATGENRRSLSAAEQWALDRSLATGEQPDPLIAAIAAEQAARDAEGTPDARAQGDPALRSWRGPGPVSATPKPVELFGREKKTVRNEAAEAALRPAGTSRGMAPPETVWPVPGQENAVTSRFGWEDDPVSGKRRWNAGIKISAGADAPVRAVLPGTVVYAGEREGYGYTVVLEHKDGYRSYYSNLAGAGVRVGDKIAHGAEFAKIAAQPSGQGMAEKTAPLHFELKKGEMALNPESAIDRNARASG